MRKIILMLAVSLLAMDAHAEYKPKKVRLSQAEARLGKLINDYRAEHGLKEVDLSRQLTYTGQKHAWDLVVNRPDQDLQHPGCLAQSWSRTEEWDACCVKNYDTIYCSWSKPKELAGYATALSFEIPLVAVDRDTPVNPEQVMAWIRGSKEHSDAILQRGFYENRVYRALGIGLFKGVASIWLGDDKDPDGKPKVE